MIVMGGVTTGGCVWLIGGAILAAVCAVAWERYDGTEDDDWGSGLTFFCVWLFAPFVAAGLVAFGLIGATAFLARWAERRIPERRSRDELEARITELERDLQVGEAMERSAPVADHGTLRR